MSLPGGLVWGMAYGSSCKCLQRCRSDFGDDLLQETWILPSLTLGSTHPLNNEKNPLNVFLKQNTGVIEACLLKMVIAFLEGHVLLAPFKGQRAT